MFARTKKISLRRPLDAFSFLSLFFFVSCALFNSFYIDKHLSADGVNYFIIILDTADFTYISWSRQFANYLTQWPLVLAVKLGLREISLLSSIFAFGLYFPYILSFGLCLYAIRHENKTLLIFPILSVVSINLSSDYILAGEHHVMVLLSWPILFFSLRRQMLTFLDSVLLLTLLVLFSRMYETAVIPALIYIQTFFIRLYYFHDIKQTIVNIFSIFLCAVIFMIALYFIISPRDSSNRQFFIDGFINVLTNLEALTAISFICLFTVGLLLRNNVSLIPCILPITFYIYIILFSSHGVSAHVSFSSRTLSITLLPILLIAAVFSWYRKVSFTQIGLAFSFAFILVMVTGNLHFSNDWNIFRQQVMQIVRVRSGYIPIEETTINENPYRWFWNNTQLGVVWAEPCVRAILMNPANVQWEPFNPRKTLLLKGYVEYEEFFKSVDQDIKLCKSAT